MKRLLTLSKTLLATAALTALVTSAVHAGGINLSWTDCGVAGTPNRTSACNSNTGANTLIASAIAPVVMDQLNGMAGVMDLQTNQASLSPWWHLETGGCRGTSLSFNFNFAGGPFTCFDIWAGGASGGINATAAFGGPNRMRIRAVCAVPGSVPADNVSEMYIYSLLINMAKTTGTGNCAGCTDGACIVLNSIQLTQPIGVGDYTLANALNNNFVTWQSGGGGIAGGCPQAVPTQNKTWGSVKSLYR